MSIIGSKRIQRLEATVRQHEEEIKKLKSLISSMIPRPLSARTIEQEYPEFDDKNQVSMGNFEAHHSINT